jgi:RNA polymerase sigma-32 factor
MGYRGFGVPISEVISEGNVGLIQAVKRFEPDKGFRLATHAMWWIKVAIQEYILRSWSLVKMGTHRQPEEAVLQPAQGQEPDFRAGGERPASRSGQAHGQAAGRDREGGR